MRGRNSFSARAARRLHGGFGDKIRSSPVQVKSGSAVLSGVVALAITVGGCDSEPVVPAATGVGPVRFDEPAVGQRSRYLFFFCDHYGNPVQGTQIYAPDTLQLFVANLDGNRFRIEESLTMGSASRHGATNVTDAESTYTYWLQVDGDSLLVPTDIPSRIFWTRLQRDLPLGTISGPETRFVGWQPDLPYHESLVTASVVDHTQFGHSFDRLNLLMDNRMMQVDGPGFMFAYAAETGLVRWAYYRWWGRLGSGWDLLPD